MLSDKNHPDAENERRIEIRTGGTPTPPAGSVVDVGGPESRSLRITTATSLSLTDTGTFRSLAFAATTPSDAVEELRQLRSALAHAVEAIARLDSQGRYVTLNQAYAAMVGYPHEDLLGQRWELTIHPDDRAVVSAALRATAGEPRVELEVRGQRGDGGVMHQRVVLVATHDANGAATGHYCFAKEISAQRTAVEALRTSEEQFRQTFDHAPIGIGILDMAGRFVRVNHALCDLTGYAAAELVALHEADISDPDDVAATADEMARLVDGDGPHAMLNKRYVCKDGAAVAVALHVSIVRDEVGTPLLFICQVEDATARLQAEQDHAQLASIIESSDEAIISSTVDGVVLSWNAGAERLYGYTADEMRGQSIDIVVPAERKEEFASIQMRLARGGRVSNFETLRLRRGGEIVGVSLSISPIIDADGQITSLCSIARDITAQHKIRQQLVFAERMASVGTLASGVAHEINNPLAYVKSNLDFATGELPRLVDAFVRATEHPGGTASAAGASALVAGLREVTEALTEARLGADRVRDIVRDLKTFSRADDEHRAPIDVRRVIDSTLNMAWNEIRLRARLVKDLRPVPFVDASESRLGQVLLNLFVNAAQAIPEGNPQGHEVRVSTGTDAAGRAVITVGDTGSGIAAEHLPRLFDPFFTTKPVGVGTGLGLSICHGIVTALGGEIHVDTQLGAGSTFRVVLPASAPPARPTPPAMESIPAASRRGRVLCLDDEPLVLASLRRTLSLEHDVVALSRGVEVVARIAAGERFDVIVSDLMMPELTGTELYNELMRIAPDQAARMIFVTGGAFTASARAFLDAVPNPCMQKPFDARLLRALVRRMVTAAR